MGKAFHGYTAPLLCGAVILSTAVSLEATPAPAGPLMYIFTQTGFADSAGHGFSVTGSFTGTPDAAGAVGLANLTALAPLFYPQ